MASNAYTKRRSILRRPPICHTSQQLQRGECVCSIEIAPGTIPPHGGITTTVSINIAMHALGVDETFTVGSPHHVYTGPTACPNGGVAVGLLTNDGTIGPHQAVMDHPFEPICTRVSDVWTVHP